MTYLVHSTEDGERIGDAVARLLATPGSPEFERLDGHFGNEISRVRVHLLGEDAERALQRVFSAIPSEMRKAIESDLESYIDEHSALFLRFDKQDLVSGGVSLGSSDPVRLKVKPRLFIVKGTAPEFYRGLLGGDAVG